MSDASALGAYRALPRAVPYAERWVFAAIVLVALAERAIIETAPDVSWLLTLGERLLAGERPYIDFIEVNPPASIFLYLPALVLARVSGLSPEFMVGLLVFAGTGASLGFSARVLVKGGVIESRSAWPLASAFAVVLLVLPAATFAQREHIALISFLPFIACAALRAQNKPVAWSAAIVAGLGAALTAIIKPHFIFPVLFVAATAAFYARSWRPLFALENWISATLALLYGAAVIMFYPEFIHDWVPIITAVYVAQKASLIDLFTLGAIPFWLGGLLVIVAMKRRAAFAPPFVLLLAASTGFFASFFAQQKGLPYHSYPMLALIFANAIVAAFDRAPQARQSPAMFIGALIAIAGLHFATFSWYAVTVDTRAIAAPIRAAVVRPKILNISGGGLVGMGFPLTRQLEGTWVGRTCGQWISAGVLAAKMRGVDAETKAKLDRYMALDLKILVEDIRNGKPDIILADRNHYDWYKWAQRDAVLAHELENYRPLAEVESVLILRRK